MDKISLRKNILDADLQKYLTIASTSAILGFTYFIGLTISILANQIDLKNYTQLTIVVILSSTILGIVIYYLINSISKIKRITKAIKKLGQKAK